jgi:hypothetical protein
MEQALQIALAIDSSVAATTANNLAVQAVMEGDMVRADELYLESARLADRLGDRSSLRFVRTNIAWCAFMRGRWDEALPEVNAFIAECEAGSPHTNEPMARMVRGSIREARGDATGALDDHRHGVELARTGDWVVQVGTSCVLAATYLRHGEREAASSLVHEVTPLISEYGMHGALVNVAHLLEPNDAAKLRSAVEATPADVGERWRAAVLLQLDRDLLGAADLLAEIGTLPVEAELRLYAGERLLADGNISAQAELTKALAFFRSVHASYFVERAEALLAPRAQRDSA